MDVYTILQKQVLMLTLQCFLCLSNVDAGYDALRWENVLTNEERIEYIEELLGWVEEAEKRCSEEILASRQIRKKKDVLLKILEAYKAARWENKKDHPLYSDPPQYTPGD
jgi:hypothetical protein